MEEQVELTPIMKQVREDLILLAYNKGLSYADVARIFNISKQRAYQLINNARAKKNA